MRITVGSTVLGDLDERPVGGFKASADPAIQRGKGACNGLSRLTRRGSYFAQFSVPTKLTFPTVAEAQKWICDTAKAGGVEGLLLFVFADGSETRFPWAVAKPDDLKHQGVLVTAVWQIEAGERLT